jgi:signal transduction histidine kinase
MRTHVDLVYEQLDTLIDLLIEESHQLIAQENDHSPYRDDLELLVQVVDGFAMRWDEAEQALQNGYSADLFIGHLRALINRILGFSELLLNNAEDTFSPMQVARLQHIHASGYDLREIVEDICAR